MMTVTLLIIATICWVCTMCQELLIQQIFLVPHMNAREKVNKIDKALKFMFKWRNNKYIGNYIGSWRVVRTLENGRSRVN